MRKRPTFRKTTVAGFFDNPKRIESVIMGMLQKKQLAAEARAAHLDRDPAVKAQIELAVTTALAKAQVEQHRKQLKLPDFKQLANEYYLGHKDEFVIKGNVTVEHVLIGTKDKAHTESEAHALADKVYAEAKAHPDRFEALVEKYSDDPSKANNKGRIENAQSPKMAHAFAEAAEQPADAERDLAARENRIRLPRAQADRAHAGPPDAVRRGAGPHRVEAEEELDRRGDDPVHQRIPRQAAAGEPGSRRFAAHPLCAAGLRLARRRSRRPELSRRKLPQPEQH